MPRKPWKVRAVKEPTDRRLSETAFLYFGWGPFFEAEHFEEEFSEAERLAMWRRFREPIMARYSAECRAKGPGWAGERPWPFWEWEDRELRRPTPSREFSSQRVWDRQRRLYDWVETDWQYLRRLDLLADWELEAGDPDRGKAAST